MKTIQTLTHEGYAAKVKYDPATERFSVHLPRGLTYQTGDLKDALKTGRELLRQEASPTFRAGPLTTPRAPGNGSPGSGPRKAPGRPADVSSGNPGNTAPAVPINAGTAPATGAGPSYIPGEPGTPGGPKYKPGRPMLRRNGEYGWNLHSHDVLPLLGLRPGEHLPAAGLPPRVIQGVKVWVAMSAAPTGRKSATHRVLAECPLCGKVLSVGRLHQHKC